MRILFVSAIALIAASSSSVMAAAPTVTPAPAAVPTATPAAEAKVAVTPTPAVAVTSTTTPAPAAGPTVQSAPAPTVTPAPAVAAPTPTVTPAPAVATVPAVAAAQAPAKAEEKVEHKFPQIYWQDLMDPTRVMSCLNRSVTETYPSLNPAEGYFFIIKLTPELVDAFKAKDGDRVAGIIIGNEGAADTRQILMMLVSAAAKKIDSGALSIAECLLGSDTKSAAELLKDLGLSDEFSAKISTTSGDKKQSNSERNYAGIPMYVKKSMKPGVPGYVYEIDFKYTQKLSIALSSQIAGAEQKSALIKEIKDLKAQRDKEGGDAGKKIPDAQAKVKDLQKKFDDAKAKADSDTAAAQTELDSAKAEVDSANAELAKANTNKNAKAKATAVSAANSKISAAKAKVDSAQQKLDALKKSTEPIEKDLNSAKADLDKLMSDPAAQKYQNLTNQLGSKIEEAGRVLV